MFGSNEQSDSTVCDREHGSKSQNGSVCSQLVCGSSVFRNVREPVFEPLAQLLVEGDDYSGSQERDK
jgi:hypothetical protein